MVPMNAYTQPYVRQRLGGHSRALFVFFIWGKTHMGENAYVENARIDGSQPFVTFLTSTAHQKIRTI